MFSGRVCLVVGGSGGVGSELVRVLVERGCSTVFTYASGRERAEALLKSLGGPGSAEAVRLDASDPLDCARVAEHVERSYGRLNHLAVLAGVSSQRLWTSGWDELGLEDYLEVFRIDFGGFLNTLKAFKGLLLRSEPASVVAISSTPAMAGDTQGYPYMAAKAAVAAMAKALARALAPRVRVNVAALGSIGTSWLSWLPGEGARELASYTLLKRIGAPGEAARAIAFLLSDDSSYITGQVLVIDGGELIS